MNPSIPSLIFQYTTRFKSKIDREKAKEETYRRRWRRLRGLIRDRVEEHSGEIGYEVNCFAPK